MGEAQEPPPSHHPGWTWFRSKLVEGSWTRDDLEPLHEELSPSLQGVLQQIRTQAGTGLATSIALHRMLRGKDSASFLFRVAPGDPLLCATVVQARGRHRLRQIEAITLDLGDLPPLPCDARLLPGPSEETASWIREEIAMTERVRLYNHLAVKQSLESALAWVSDGAAFLLAARSWIPYMEPGLAFLWYAAWSETHLHRNPVIVRQANPLGGRLVMVDPLHRRLYRQTTHLRKQISKQDYEALFEAAWRDRAENAGFHLTVQGSGQLELAFSPIRPDSPCQLPLA
jgi:hypothetical protein